MTTTTNQFRIEFTSSNPLTNNKKESSQWFNTIEEALQSRWYNEKDATIIERERPTHMSFAEYKASKKIKAN